MTPAPARPGWKLIATVLAFWSIVALLAAVADFADQSRARLAPALSDKLLLYTFVFLPFAGFSTALAFAFARWQGLLAPPKLALLYVAVLLTFLPLYEVYEMAVILKLDNKPVPGPVALLAMTSAWGRWLDTLMTTLAFAVQAAYANWLSGLRSVSAARQAHAANLDMRLALLQGQLEPAFLLSSLDGIASLVRNAARSDATRTLARLSELLRYALRASQQQTVSVADEIAFGHDYADLQTMRLGGRLRVDWDTGPVDWHAHACPPLLLHAVIDQAIACALADDRLDCHLSLRLTIDGDTVQARADWPGPAGAADAPSVSATRERLALLFGADGSLHTMPNGQGQCAVLTFPASRPADD